MSVIKLPSEIEKQPTVTADTISAFLKTNFTNANDALYRVAVDDEITFSFASRNIGRIKQSFLTFDGANADGTFAMVGVLVKPKPDNVLGDYLPNELSKLYTVKEELYLMSPSVCEGLDNDMYLAGLGPVFKDIETHFAHQVKAIHKMLDHTAESKGVELSDLNSPIESKRIKVRTVKRYPLGGTEDELSEEANSLVLDQLSLKYPAAVDNVKTVIGRYTPPHLTHMTDLQQPILLDGSLNGSLVIAICEALPWSMDPTQVRGKAHGVTLTLQSAVILPAPKGQVPIDEMFGSPSRPAMVSPSRSANHAARFALAPTRTATAKRSAPTDTPEKVNKKRK